jgi:hypothetical protein
MDNRDIGDAAKLRDIPAVDIAELRYLPSNAAIARFGTGVEGSVIVVTRS